jgi:hypothetical protein
LNVRVTDRYEGLWRSPSKPTIWRRSNGIGCGTSHGAAAPTPARRCQSLASKSVAGACRSRAAPNSCKGRRSHTRSTCLSTAFQPGPIDTTVREQQRECFWGQLMKSRLALGVAALLCVGVTVAEAAQAERSPGVTEKTARIALVREFIREMEVLHRLQETAKKEFAEDSSAAGKLTTSIRVGTRTLFEMRENVSRLDMIGLDTRLGGVQGLA